MKKEISKIEILRHSAAHVLAAAVLEMFPEAKFGIGPAVENGFYYDFDLPRTLIPEDLEILEDKMKKIIQANHKFERVDASIEEAEKDFKELGQSYKIDLIQDLKDEGNKKVCIYKAGHFVDLCSGPHIDSTGEIKPDAFKLTRISGAYWKSDEKNKQLQRIYGLAFESKKELDVYLKSREDAKERDHRKIGQELDLFTFSDLVGPGLPMFTPKGTVIREELYNALAKISKKYNYQRVIIPHMAKIKLYEKSGHAEKFKEELFKVISHYDEFVLKPVNCPHHTQIYASRPRSYRDLPIRYMESTVQHRDEKPGEIGGLTRTRSFMVDDGHLFCTLEQVEQEVKNIANIIEEFYKGIGLWGNHWISLSVRDYSDFSKYIGEEKDWEKAEEILKNISNELKLDAKKMEGEAAIYGPKIDYMFKDSLGRERQLATIQLDFSMPKRFGLEYTDKDGKKKTPIMIHRAILGSYERFMAILIEHFAGAFPLWLSPVQAIIIPVSEKFDDYGEKVFEKLKNNDIRAEIDKSSESLGKRIREAEHQKIPYILVVGEKEEKAESVAVRRRENNKPASTRGESTRGGQEVMKIKEFVEKMENEIEKKN